MISFEDLKKGVIGKKTADAEKWLKDAGMEMRVVKENNERLMVTQDVAENRVNVATVDGEVTEVINLG